VGDVHEDAYRGRREGGWGTARGAEGEAVSYPHCQVVRSSMDADRDLSSQG